MPLGKELQELQELQNPRAEFKTLIQEVRNSCTALEPRSLSEVIGLHS
jgi:hypothetical protein